VPPVPLAHPGIAPPVPLARSGAVPAVETGGPAALVPDGWLGPGRGPRLGPEPAPAELTDRPAGAAGVALPAATGPAAHGPPPLPGRRIH